MFGGVGGHLDSSGCGGEIWQKDRKERREVWMKEI